MQTDNGRRSVNYQFYSDHLVGRASGGRDNASNMSSDLLLVPSLSPSPMPSSSLPYGGVNCIEHHVSKMDTLAGVAIKYGVEVADIKRMNGLVTDRQMFALKSLQIPLPGRHPPSPALSNGSANSGQLNYEHTPPRRRHSDALESFQSLRLKSPQQKISLAMSTLQGYYGLKPSNHKGAAEGTEMAVYRTGKAHYLEDGLLPKPSLSVLPPNGHRKSKSLVDDCLLENELTEDMPVKESEFNESEKSNEKSVRRRQKSEADFGSCTPEMLLKEDTSGGSRFSATTGQGLALRPKSASRTNLVADADSGWLNTIPVGMGDSLMADGFNAVRKSSSTSSLQDQEQNGSLSMWPTSNWSLKQDLQALSTAAITRPIFDGLPRPPITRWNKAALD